jgi:biopolymer transport protein ExbD
MHGGSGGGGKKARIEIIPLIDIIFFLLATFIMVSLSMTKNQGITVALPPAAAPSLGDQKELDKAVTLNVNAKGEIFYNKEKVTVVQLRVKLQTYKSTAKEPKVILGGDADADYKQVVAVLDEVKKMGINKVALSTEAK